MDDDWSTMSGAASPASRPQAGAPIGLRAQAGATFAAVKRLIRAHVDLAKTEVGEIVDEVKRMVALAGVAIVVLILAGMLFWIGGILFLGEWLFGSIGWGVLLGTFLLLDIAAIAVLLALDVKGRRIGSALIVAVALGVVVGLLLGFDLPHQGWTAASANLSTGLDPGTQTTLLAIGTTALVLAVVGLVWLWIKRGFRAAIGGAVALAILGAFLGWLTSIAIAPQVGAALGVLVVLLTWPVLAGRDLQDKGIDQEGLKAKFIPSESIELTKETIEWVRARTPLVPRS